MSITIAPNFSFRNLSTNSCIVDLQFIIGSYYERVVKHNNGQSFTLVGSVAANLNIRLSCCNLLKRLHTVLFNEKVMFQLYVTAHESVYVRLTLLPLIKHIMIIDRASHLIISPQNLINFFSTRRHIRLFIRSSVTYRVLHSIISTCTALRVRNQLTD